MKNISMPIRIITILYLVVYVFSMSVYIAHAEDYPVVIPDTSNHFVIFSYLGGYRMIMTNDVEEVIYTMHYSTPSYYNSYGALKYYTWIVASKTWGYSENRTHIPANSNWIFLYTNRDILNIIDGGVYQYQNVNLPLFTPTPEPTPTPIITPTPIPSPSVDSVGQIVPIVESSLINVVFSVTENEKAMLSVELLFITVMCLIYIVRKIFKVFGGA